MTGEEAMRRCKAAALATDAVIALREHPRMGDLDGDTDLQAEAIDLLEEKIYKTLSVWEGGR